MADEIKQENTLETPQGAPAEESKEEKTALEEVVSEAEKPKVKKGKLDYEEINPQDIAPGMLVRVHQKIVDINPKGEEKERTQVFQGMVLAHKHGTEAGATITVRKVSGGIGVEKIFPLKMPSLTKFELVRTYRTRQAKPYYLRTTKKRLREIKA
ncbi:MAG: 50S ribosomal protein L19 [Parcubacteria group bacterium]|nr:50S ribosomal protein L19 [Parcubacteria group bacterium]